jgi:hypothetical protein
MMVVETICTWPNGERKKVYVLSRGEDTASIVWDDEISGERTGFSEEIPIGWLQVVEVKDGDP